MIRPTVLIVTLVMAASLSCEPHTRRSAHDTAPARGEALSAGEIVARHVAARGGGDAIAAVQSVRFEVEIVEPAFTVTGDYRASRAGLMRIDIYADGHRVFSEGIDRDGAWQRHGADEEIVAASVQGAAALHRGIDQNLWGLYELGSRGHRIALHGRERVADIDYYVLHLVMRDGFERYLYVHPETWMVERRREVSALHPDIDGEERPTETVHSRFEMICGTLRPVEMHKVDLLSGEQIQRTRIVASRCNPDPAALALARDVEVGSER